MEILFIILFVAYLYKKMAYSSKNLLFYLHKILDLIK